METSKYLKLNIMGENDDADILKVAENFQKIDQAAKDWSNFANTGTVLETEGDFQIAANSPIPEEEGAIFSITVKMPRTFAEDDTITVDDVAYTLYQGSDPADSEAWKAGEVVTLNFDKSARRCWAGGGGGVPKPLPAQISNLKGVAVEGETPKIDWTWTNPTDENFAGMVLVVKEGSSPNGPTDGVQVYKGSSTTVTQSEGLQFERTYYARGFAYNSQGKYQMNAEGATATVELSAVPEQVSDVTLTPNKSHATLSWTNPVSTNLQTIKVIQKIGSDPENPNDGTQVYEGTGTTVTVDNLQDSIDYRFGIFAIGKNGKYKDPVVKNYTPAIYPKYTYTGEHALVKDENDHWRIRFLYSGILEWLDEDTKIDAFIVGAGGGGDYAGGGGGYTKTVRNITLTRGQRINIIVGSGGTGSKYTVSSTDGGSSSFGEHTAQGGKRSNSLNGGDGGSGGGAHFTGIGVSFIGGNGGSDGANGEDKIAYGSSSSITTYGGRGQGSTTREFGETAGPIHAGGGGGSAQNVRTDHETEFYPVSGGKGGEGSGIKANGGTIPTIYSSYSAGGLGGGGYGGGGGGGININTETYKGGGNGSQGIVIIRDAQEAE